MRPIYRLRQFWDALGAAPTADGLEQARRFLPPALMELFLRQQPSEQAHSLKIFLKLIEQGETSTDLLAAALLHDVGKSCFPLNVRDRVLVVLGQALSPELVQRWGDADPGGWKRPFVVAKRHPVWGAELAERAGATDLCVRLIRRHQGEWESSHETLAGNHNEDHLLIRLQRADNES